jgi:Calcineurin-like phosphoesterase.
MFEPIAVIGDVHGDAIRLERMLSALSDREGRTVLVGDYIDRGPDSAAVLELLLAAIAGGGGKITALAGNHEAELLRFIETGDFVRYAAAGGMATIRSYVGIAWGDVHGQFVAALPDAHRELLASLPSHLETDWLLISHAGFDPLEPHLRTREVMVNGRYPDLLADEDVKLPRPIVVCGHYVQRSGTPFHRSGLYCVDTGCGTIGGPLTALLLPEGTFLSI